MTEFILPIINGLVTGTSLGVGVGIGLWLSRSRLWLVIIDEKTNTP